MSKGYQLELTTAVSAAKKAGDYLMSTRETIELASMKDTGTKNYVTKQDLESDRIIIEAIREPYPSDFILSEETGDDFDVQNTDRFWIIDPIDGTRNFANGIRYFSVSVAFFAEGKVQAGAVYAPAYGDEMYTAVRGGGAFLNDKPLRLTDKETDLGKSVVVTGFAYFRGGELTALMKPYEEVVNTSVDVLRMGSGALDTCQVAASRIGAFYESGLKPWDVAVGSLLVEESGGVIGDYQGKPLDLFRTRDGKFSIDVLASRNYKINDQIVRIINR